MEDEWMCETVETILSLSLSLRYFKDACSRRIIVVSCAHHDINTFDHGSFPFFDDFMQISRYPRHTPASNLKLTWKLRDKEWQGFRTIFWKLSWTLIERCWLVLSDGDERQDDFRSFIGYVGKFNETIFNEYGLNSKRTITPDYFVVIVRIFLLFFFFLFLLQKIYRSSHRSSSNLSGRIDLKTKFSFLREIEILTNDPSAAAITTPWVLLLKGKRGGLESRYRTNFLHPILMSKSLGYRGAADNDEGTRSTPSNITS